MSNINYKPSVKWVGGKTRMIPTLLPKFPPSNVLQQLDVYVEPFLGGGSMLLHILTNENFKKYYVNDKNPYLIKSYAAIKSNIDQLLDIISEYETLIFENSDIEGNYYKLRNEFNSKINVYKYVDNYDDISIEDAALFLLINKLCFRGIFRTNSDGKYNVPFGNRNLISKYEKNGNQNVDIVDKNNLIKLHDLFQPVNFYSGDFSKMNQYVCESAFMYLDPPYFKHEKTHFSKYGMDDFNIDMQQKLFDWIKICGDTGCKILYNNSYSENLNPYYQNLMNSSKYYMDVVNSKQIMVQDVCKKREEVVIRNYPCT